MSKVLGGFIAGMLVVAIPAWLMWPRGVELPKAASAESPVINDVAGLRATPARGDAPVSARAASGLKPENTTVAGDATNRETRLELPGGKLESQRQGEVEPLDKLLSSMRVDCKFDPGAGGYWPKGQLQPHTAAWMGGPIEFESIDLVEQTAQMLGTEGATGSLEGKMSIRVTATDSGLHFSGFKPDGELIAVTVFGALDAERRYLAVMSGHGTRFDHESAQFYGACTVR